MLVRKKKYDAIVAELELVIMDRKRLVEDNATLLHLVKSKENEIFRLNEKIRNLQKKPFKK